MTQEQFANAAQSTLATGITSTQGTLVVASAGTFPSVPQFRILVDAEIMLVTAVSDSTFSITRGIEGTGLAAHAVGATVTQIITAGALADALAASRAGYNIDFVRDCGADPTGVADCAPAFDVAYAILSSLADMPAGLERSVRLALPPGVYALLSAPTTATWNFDFKATNCEIVGAGRDASIIQLNGFDLPRIGGLQSVRIADLTLQGVTSGDDCVYGLELDYIAQSALLERVRFFNIRARFSVAYLVYCVSVHVRDCSTVCCSSQTDGWGVTMVQGCINTHYESCVHYDVGYLNGIGNATKFVGNRAWLVVQGDYLKGGDQLVSIEDCFFDEHARAQFRVIGQADYPIASLIVRNVECNPPVEAPQLCCLDMQYINNVTIDGFANNSFNPSSTSFAPTLRMSGVDAASVRNLRMPPHPPSNSNYITADSSVGVLSIDESPTLLTANILSSAARTFVTSAGTRAVLLKSTNAAVGDVLKVASVGGVAGYHDIATTDGVGRATAIALDEPASSPGPVRGAISGQRVAVLSDGTTSIAIGDPVTTVGAAAAGQVLRATPTGTTSIIGVAMSAAAAGSPVLFDVWFQVGEA